MDTRTAVPVNALGEPSPGRTDFKHWTREGLEHIARTAVDENLKLRADNELLLDAWRAEVIDRARLLLLLNAERSRP